jgi:hypothetical protein
LEYIWKINIPEYFRCFFNVRGKFKSKFSHTFSCYQGGNQPTWVGYKSHRVFKENKRVLKLSSVFFLKSVFNKKRSIYGVFQIKPFFAFFVTVKIKLKQIRFISVAHLT